MYLCRKCGSVLDLKTVEELRKPHIGSTHHIVQVTDDEGGEHPIAVLGTFNCPGDYKKIKSINVELG